MGLTQEELDAIFKPMEESLVTIMQNKDIDGIMSLYHPEAVIIGGNAGAFYGCDAIRRAYEQWMQFAAAPRVVPTYVSSSEDGEYLIRRATWSVKGDPRTYNYEGIFKLCEDRYLIIYEKSNGPSMHLYGTCSIS